MAPSLGRDFLLAREAARDIEQFVNHVRLALLACLLLLAYLGFLPGDSQALLLLTADIGIAWVITVGLLIRRFYRPWIAFAIGLVDVALVSILVYRTGGPSSPLDALYGILLFAAIIRFNRFHATLFTIAVTVAYLEVTWLHPGFEAATHANELAARALLFGATGFLAWLVSAEVGRQRRAVVQAQEKLAGLSLVAQVAEVLSREHTDDGVLSSAAVLAARLSAADIVVATLLTPDGTNRLVAVEPSRPAHEADLSFRADRTESLELPPTSSSGASLVRTLESAGYREIVAMPIGPRRKPEGWLYVGQGRGHELTIADRALLQRVADESTEALARARLLQLERERSRSLAQLAQENGELLQQERETVGRLRQLASHKDSFIDLIAHELRTPLTSIRGFAQMLLRDNILPPAGSRYAGVILSESTRLTTIIEDIVDLSYMERGLLDMAREPVDIAAVLEDIVTDGKAAGMSVTLEVDGELPRVRGDADKLRQTFAGLLALGAREHQGEEALQYGARSESDSILIWLDVRGSLSGHQFQNIFERVPSSDEPPRGNLRLYISRNFVEAHGGRLWIDSGQRCCRICVRLPALGRPTPEGDVAASTSSTSRATQPLSTGVSRRRPHRRS